MIIIIEGCDFTGKSTLALQLANDLNAFMLRSKKPKEFKDLLTWVNMAQSTFDDPIVCDRTPLISERIYGPIIRGDSIISARQSHALLNSLGKVIIVHCDPGFSRVSSVNNDQMAGVKENILPIYNSYNEVMSQIRLPLYQYDYQNPEAYWGLIDLINEVETLNWTGDMMQSDYEVQAVENFHKKYGVPMPHYPQLLAPDVLEFRKKFLQEELNEFLADHAKGDLVKSFDALLDLDYVLKGTALLMGISPEQWAAGFDAVQKANMSKIRVTLASQSKRGSSLDVIKPDGWVGPEQSLSNILAE